jgi:hypothetical protein
MRRVVRCPEGQVGAGLATRVVITGAIRSTDRHTHTLKPNIMAEFTKDPGNRGTGGFTGDRASGPGATGGTGYTGGAGGTGYTGGTGGTGYGGGTGNEGDPEHRHHRPGPREPKSSAALWIVGIVVVVGALAIWIARNTVDEQDTMQGRPGMDQTATDRDFDRDNHNRTAPYGTGTTGRDFENRQGDQGSFGTDAGDRGMDAGERGTMEGQQGTGTIPGQSNEDPRFNTGTQGTGTHGTGTMGTQGGGTGTVGGGTTGTGTTGTGTTGAGTTTAPEGTGTTGTGTTGTGTTGTGTTGTGTGTGTTGTNEQEVGTGAGTGTGTTTP